MAFLTASTSPVLIPLGSTGTTTIEWFSGNPDLRAKIFERTNVSGTWSSWNPRNLMDPAVRGSYTVRFRPGDVYDAMMFLADQPVDPNDQRNEVEPLATIRVFALLSAPTGPLITDGALPEQHDVGGTYYARKFATGSTATFASLQLGKTPPITDAAGFLQIPAPIGVLAPASAQTMHDFVVTPLDPGSLYFSVIRVHDSSGNWQQMSYAFTTKRRNVRLQWKELFINDDGVDVGSGSGHFQVYAYEGPNLFEDMLNDIWWQRIASFNTGQRFDIMPQAAIVHTGPRIVGDDNRRISIFLRGIGFRSWPQRNDIATSALGVPHEILLPFGRGRETVVNKTQSFHAMPKSGGGITENFSFTIQVIVNVTYAP